MKEYKRGFGRVVLYAGVASALAISAFPAAGVTSTYAQGSSRTINGHVVNGRFLEEWSKQGSEQANVYVNGLPITDRRAEISLTDGKTYDTQWFERARFEAHPENKTPYDVLFGLLGVTLTEGRGVVDPATKKVRNAADAAFVKVDKPADTGATKLWFPETGHTLSGKILEYWNKYGGLKQFGFPLSEQFAEISATDGKTYQVQYFERNRFELHPEKAAPYEVELGLLGVQQYKAQPIPADQLPIAPPKNVTSKKDTLVTATAQEPESLIGLEESTVTGVRHLGLIDWNNALVYADNTETYFPLAAWYVPTLENGGSFFVGAGADRHLVVKYKLRRGVKYNDGTEVTSQDAITYYNLLFKDPNTDPSSYFKVSTIDNPDKYTILYNYMSVNEATAKFNDPKTNLDDYDFLRLFIAQKKPVVDPGYYSIGGVIAAAYGKLDPTKLTESSLAEKPIGYGPFMVDHWTHGVEMVLVQNPNYNLTDKPLLKRIVIKEGVNLDSAYQQIKAGDLDQIAGEAVLVPPANADDLKANGVVIDALPAASWEHIDFFFGFAPFQDHAVREGIIRAINRQQLVDKIYKGASKVMNTLVPPFVKTSVENPDYAKNFPDLNSKYAASFPKYPYDPAAAAKVLNDAGWVAGADGIRAKGGQKLSFTYDTTNNSTRQAMVQLVIQDLKAVGIDAHPSQPGGYKAGEYFSNSGPITTGKCQFCQFAYQQTSTSNFNAWDKSFIPDAAHAGYPNRQQYKNDAVQKANQTFNSELDAKAQAEASAIAQTEVMKDIALVPLLQRLSIEFYRNNLAGIKVSPTSYPQTWNALQWYFK